MQRLCDSIVTGPQRGKILLALIVVTLAVYFYMLVVTIPGVMAYAEGMALLDMQPVGYSAEYAHQLLERLGEEGREAYLTRQIPVDMVYPLLFAISHSFLLVFVLRRAFPPKAWACWAGLVPMAAGLFDYAENIGTISMLRSYPEFSPGLANLTSAFTIAKSQLTTLFFLVLLVGLVALWRRILRNRSMEMKG